VAAGVNVEVKGSQAGSAVTAKEVKLESQNMVASGLRRK
jgi:hypothetical protein